MNINERLNNAIEPIDMSENAFVQENVLMQMMEPSSGPSDLGEIPAQLEEILKNIYDFNPHERDFASNLNIGNAENENRMFSSTINSSGNELSTSFSGESSASLFNTAQKSELLDSSVYFTPEVPQNSSAQEDDNDPSPVYLNFNIQNMAQSAQTFNTEFEKYTNQVAMNSGMVRKNDVVNYVEYINNLEEAWQPVEMTSQQNQMFRPIPTNIISAPIVKYPIQKIYNFPQDVERLNGAFVTEVMSSYQPLNTNTLPVKLSATPRQNTPNNQRNVISRKPLQTKLSIKINNNEWDIINKGNASTNEGMCSDAELLAIDQTVPNIPFLNEPPPGRKQRKQTLTLLADSDISFMDARGEFTNYEADRDSPALEVKPLLNTEFITFRKKPKLHVRAASPDMSPTTSRSGRSPQQIQREVSQTKSPNSSAILVSSNSDSEDDVESSETKCLKCCKCNKMFKTPRSYSIHKKRCDVPSNADSTYVIDVEYLESEKEDEFEEMCVTESKNASYQDDSIEIVESDSFESLEDIKQEIFDESERSDENTVRRNTRSSSLKSSSTTNSAFSSLSSPSKSLLKKATKKVHTSCVEAKPATTMPSCEICGKKFRQKGYLVAHKRIHEKNFKCQFCFKTFPLKSLYDLHILEKCDKIPSVKLKRLRSAVSNKITK